MLPQHGNKGFFLLLCCLVLITPRLASPHLSAAADTVIKVFKIHYRFAEDFERTVEMFLSPEGSVVADKISNSLIVKDYPENINAVAEFLKTQDTVQTQVRVTMQFTDETALRENGFIVHWSAGGSHWTVGTAAGPGLNIHALLKDKHQKLRKSGELSLLVMSGRSGRLETGMTIAYTDWFYHYARRHGHLSVETKFRDVITGFFVSPRVIGTSIHVTIMPRISYPAENGRNEILFREAATELTLKDGETVLLAGSTKSSETLVQNILSGRNAQDHKENTVILLTAETVK